jgi:crotonobetainyl-CoA:carnitine CoA-transferase CaiB-like acyl-CoA transferase
MGALNGVRVLEIAEGIAAPVAAMLLADHGAEVIKVERPTGDYARGQPGFAVWNRGKRSVIVDRASPADLALLAAQIRGADICILGEGEELADFAPNVADAARANGGLVIVRFPAWLRGCLPWFGGEASHGLLAAYGGLGWRQSSNDGGPVEPISYFISYVQAAWGATCALAALYERGSNGHGQEVTVSGVNGLMEALIHPYSVDPHAPDPPTDIGSFGRHPTYRPYQAGDGKWVGSGALGAKFETMLLDILGIPEVLSDPRIGGDVERMKNPAHLDWVMETVAAAFRKRPRDEWIEILMKAGIPCGAVNPREELLDHPQTVAIRMRLELDDPERGRTTMPGIPTNLTATPGEVTGPAPMLNQHRSLPPWSPRPDPIARRRYAPGPLSGVKVMNLGTFVATPYAGLLLSELGADVVKVEPLTGDPFRVNGYPHNRGMRSVAIDLNVTTGREAFKRIAASADIVIDGMRPGVIRRMGIDHDTLAAIKPDIITLSLSGFGEKGPLSQLPGFDMVMQGFCGIMLAQGDETEPVASTVAYVDVTTASLNAFGCMLALLHRQRSGEGQHVWNSLIGTAAYLQLAELVRYPGRPAPRQGCPDYRGAAWFDRYYQSSDGWVRIDAATQVDALRAYVARHRALSNADDKAFEAALAEIVSALGVDEAVAGLNGAGVPAVRTRKVSELFADADLMSSEFAHFGRSESGTIMSMPGRYASFSRTQRWGPMRPPGLGEHSRVVLGQAGFSNQEIEALIESDSIRQGTPMPVRFGTTYR